MKFQSIDRPTQTDPDAILIYTEERGNSILIGVMNEKGEKEPIFMFSENGVITMNMPLPPCFAKLENGNPFIDMAILH